MVSDELQNRMMDGGVEASPSMEREFVTIAEATEITGLSRRTLERWVKKGALTTFQIRPRHAHLIRRKDLSLG
jgi:excisionase family DNA binding protein